MIRSSNAPDVLQNRTCTTLTCRYVAIVGRRDFGHELKWQSGHGRPRIHPRTDELFARQLDGMLAGVDRGAVSIRSLLILMAVAGEPWPWYQ